MIKVVKINATPYLRCPCNIRAFDMLATLVRNQLFHHLLVVRMRNHASSTNAVSPIKGVVQRERVSRLAIAATPIKVDDLKILRA